MYNVTTYIGLDIGGTKIAGAIFDGAGVELARQVKPTPCGYSDFVTSCVDLIHELDKSSKASVGIGAPYGAANMPFILGKDVAADIGAALGRPVRLANDANCAALAEAIDGAGAGYNSVFGLILGTGVAGGLILNGKIVAGVNGLAGEIGHLPLPYYEPADGVPYPCGCGQKGCIEKLVSGGGLSRLYESMTKEKADAAQIATKAEQGDAKALHVLDRYYTVVAKAMVTIIHSFDPEIITVSGGVSALPGLYQEVPKRWGQYAIVKNPKTKFVPAKHGTMAGLRGAAWLWRD